MVMGGGVVAEDPARRDIQPVEPFLNRVPERPFADLAVVVRNRFRLPGCASYPFTQAMGFSFATLRARRAWCVASTTAETSL